MPYDHKELIRKFRELYEKDEYSSQIADIISEAHGKKSIVIDYSELSEFDPDLAEMFPDDPEFVIRAAEDSLFEKIKETYDTERKGLHARFKNFPPHSRVSIRALRSEHVGKFVVIEALVKKASEVRPKLIEAAFQCTMCLETYLYPQGEGRISEPLFCKGCDRGRNETRFKLQTHKSVFVDEERLEVQELPEKLEGGQQPQRMIALAEDDMAGILAPGDRVTIYGILKAVPRMRGNIKSTTFDFRLQVNYVEKENKEYSEIEPDEEEIAEIERIAHSEDVMDIVVGSIAPTVQGLPEVKKALALQLFGGVAKEMPDGTHIRGDIHTLLVGDPGTAKSQMLRYMSDLSPRGVYASGKSASAAGLTAAAVKDEGGDGRWTLEAGALVMADGGIACIDEMDKMSKEDRSSMHEAMEQQTITVVKAGISATLKSRCALLGAANPKYGRFSNSDEIFKEMDLPAPLLSRFDVIFIMRDEPNRERDASIAEHILKGHRIGEKRKAGLPMDEGEMKEHQSILNKDFLKKYVSYAKQKNPVMTDEAMDAIERYYLKTRAKSNKSESPTVAITARHLEALIRMAEATARIRLSDEVTEKDAEEAIGIMDYYLSKVLKYDTDLQWTGESSKKRSTRKTIAMAMDELFMEKDIISLEEIWEVVESRGISKDELEETLRKMKMSGEIYEPKHERYEKVRK